MTWPEKTVERLRVAQEEGQLQRKFRMKDVRRVFPACPSWVLKDHYLGNPEGRSVWFVRHGSGLYSVAPDR